MKGWNIWRFPQIGDTPVAGWLIIRENPATKWMITACTTAALGVTSAASDGLGR